MIPDRLTWSESFEKFTAYLNEKRFGLGVAKLSFPVIGRQSNLYFLHNNLRTRCSRWFTRGKGGTSSRKPCIHKSKVYAIWISPSRTTSAPIMFPFSRRILQCSECLQETSAPSRFTGTSSASPSTRVWTPAPKGTSRSRISMEKLLLCSPDSHLRNISASRQPG